MYARYGKRVVDLVLTLPALILLAPLIFLLALLIRRELGAPVFFRQERPGKDGALFTIVKFRTMNDQTDAAGVLLPDEARLTGLGRFLRRTSLDELPELFNVLRGEMSLVGPRPLLARYLPLYTPAQMRRHAVRPGISGWAQVNGRNALTWEEKFALDTWYVDHQSLALDLKILFLTVWKTFAQEGISQPGHATMEEFDGSNSGAS